MTDHDIAQLRGEVFALKILVSHCLNFIASHFEESTSYLDAIARTAITRIPESAPAFATMKHRETFVNAAKGAVAGVLEAARDPHASPTPRLQ